MHHKILYDIVRGSHSAWQYATWGASDVTASAMPVPSIKGQTIRPFPCEKEIEHSSVPDVSRRVTAKELNKREARQRYIKSSVQRCTERLPTGSLPKVQSTHGQSRNRDTASEQRMAMESSHGDTASVQGRRGSHLMARARTESDGLLCLQATERVE
jgi:hypothetical protein